MFSFILNLRESDSGSEGRVRAEEMKKPFGEVIRSTLHTLRKDRSTPKADVCRPF